MSSRDVEKILGILNDEHLSVSQIKDFASLAFIALLSDQSTIDMNDEQRDTFIYDVKSAHRRLISALAVIEENT